MKEEKKGMLRKRVRKHKNGCHVVFYYPIYKHCVHILAVNMSPRRRRRNVSSTRKEELLVILTFVLRLGVPLYADDSLERSAYEIPDD